MFGLLILGWYNPDSQKNPELWVLTNIKKLENLPFLSLRNQSEELASQRVEAYPRLNKKSHKIILSCLMYINQNL